jgi:hypothetical protein
VEISGDDGDDFLEPKAHLRLTAISAFALISYSYSPTHTPTRPFYEEHRRVNKGTAEMSKDR